MPPARSGPHQVLLALYALFTLAAGARAGVQLATEPHRAPVAYALSLVAAFTYALGWVAIRRAAAGRSGFASRMLWVELAGVLVVGTLSLVRRDLFPDMSVWSDYGIGYAFVPTALPIAGLVWLRRRAPGGADSPEAAATARTWIVRAFRIVSFAEAVSWLGLLTGMFFKYVVVAGEGGVKVFGPVHGTVFIGYVALALVTAGLQRWSLRTTVFAVLVSLPPFATIGFELWARRTGRLDHPGEPPTTGPQAPVTPSASSAPR